MKGCSHSPSIILVLLMILQMPVSLPDVVNNSRKIQPQFTEYYVDPFPCGYKILFGYFKATVVS